MSDYDDGDMCPECGCSIMNGTSWCWACGWGVEESLGPEDEDLDGMDYVGGV